MIDHTQLEHSSLCKFAETVFGLPAMSARDAASADMTDAFDFTQPPRSFADFESGSPTPPVVPGGGVAPIGSGVPPADGKGIGLVGGVKGATAADGAATRPAAPR